MASDTNAMDQLQDFLRQRRETSEPVKDLERFEQELHRRFVAAEREALGHELARFDLNVPTIDVAGERSQQVLRCATTSTRAAGPVRAERSLYRHKDGSGRAVCPLELRAGMVEGSWTPLAAKQATWVVAHLTPQEGEELFGLLGTMTPSTRTLDRLPTQLSTHWEPQRRQCETTLRAQEDIPAAAVTVAVSLDGVMVPMQDGKRHAKRTQAVAQGTSPSGPAGYQEVGCATLASYDHNGRRLCTRRMARMPEPHTRTLTSPLTAEVMGALVRRPDVRVVNVADGAPDHWRSLSDVVPLGEEVLDYSHAVDQLNSALRAAYGEGSTTYTERAETLRRVLRDEPEGVDNVLGALGRLRTRSPRRHAMHATVAYFREHRHRMCSAHVRAQHLPLGSGGGEVSHLEYPYTDNGLLSYYWPDGIIEPRRCCQQVAVTDCGRERDRMSTHVLPPRLEPATRSRSCG